MMKELPADVDSCGTEEHRLPVLFGGYHRNQGRASYCQASFVSMVRWEVCPDDFIELDDDKKKCCIRGDRKWFHIRD